MGSATSSTAFVDSHRRVPQSDLYADVEELKNEVKVSKEAIKSLKEDSKNLNEQLVELKTERDEAKEENEKLHKVIDRYVEMFNDPDQQDKMHGDIEKAWAEKENGQLIFFTIEDFFRYLRRGIIAETNDPDEIVKQLGRLEKCREDAKKNRGRNMTVAAVIGGLMAGGLMPAVIVAKVAISAKVAGACVATAVAAVPAGVLIGSFVVGGIVAGLVFFGGMYIYTKWCDRQPRDKKKQ